MPHERFGHGFFVGPPHWSLLERLTGTPAHRWSFHPVLAGGAAPRFVRRRNAAQPPVAFAVEPSALELVRRRYALGEIDAEMFEAMTVQLLASEEWGHGYMLEGPTHEQPLV